MLSLLLLLSAALTLAVIVIGAVLIALRSQVSRLERRVRQLSLASTATTTLAPDTSTSLPPAPPPAVGASVRQPLAPLITPPASRPKRAATSMSGGRLLALIGGAFVLIGAIIFLTMAIQNGWINETGQVALGVVVGAALLGAGGMTLRTRDHVVGNVTAGTGGGVITLASVVGTQRYDVLAPAAAMLLTAAAAGIVVWLAARVRGQVLAGYGIVTALAAPMLVDAPTTGTTLAFAGIALIATVVVTVAFNWQWLGLAALATTLPQLGTWASPPTGSRGATALVLVIAGWWLLLVIAALGHVLRDATRSPGAAGASLAFLAAGAATACALAGISDIEHAARVLSNPPMSTDQMKPIDHSLRNTWLWGFGGAHMVLAAAAWARRRRVDVIVTLMGVIGIALFGVATAITVGGTGRSIFWSVEVLFLLWIGRRFGDLRAFVVAGIVTYVAAIDAYLVVGDLDEVFRGSEDVVGSIAAQLPLAVASLLAAVWAWRGTRAPVMVAMGSVLCAASGTWLLTTLLVTAAGDIGTPIALAVAIAAASLVISASGIRALRITTLCGLVVLMLVTLTHASPDLLWTRSHDLVLTIGSCTALAFALLVSTRGRVLELLGPRGKPAITFAVAAAATAMWWGASITIVHVFRPGSQEAQLALTTFWAALGLTLIPPGLARRVEWLHRTGAALLLIASAKVILVDTTSLDSALRVAAFIGVGLLLLGGGYAYVRLQKPDAPPAP